MSYYDNPQGSYDAWRKTIPWTNAEIALAFREEAKALPPYLQEKRLWQARHLDQPGARVSRNALTMVLPRLVKTCVLCGKTALYRAGVQGYCRAHKHEATRQHTSHQRVSRDPYADDKEQDMLRRDRDGRRRDTLRAYRRKARLRDRRI